eukprot:637438-Pyramimonas_sp.AAC.1
MALAPRALVFNICKELHVWKAGRSQNVALTVAPRTVVNILQVFHGWRAVGSQNVVLASAQRTFVSNICKSFTDGG